MSIGWKLYEVEGLLRRAVDAASDQINQDTGEVPEDWAKFLNDVQMERNAKALSVAAMVRELAAEAKAISLERKRLQAREEAAANRSDSLKIYLLTCLRPGEKLKDQRVSIGWSKSSSVEIIDPEKVPDQYCRFVREVQKTPIGEAIKAGTEVPGARVVEKQFIVIR